MAQPSPPTELTSTRMPGCSAWVTVDDKPLPVYSALSEGNKSIGYIEAIEGAQFKCIIATDERKRLPKTTPRISTWMDAVYAGAQVTATTQRPFQFAKLSLTDDEDRACREEQVVKNMGTLQVKVIRVKDLHDADYVPLDGLHSEVVLHEATKKATLSHQTSLAPPQASPKMGLQTRCTEIDSPVNPFYTFEFRYRSRALLELEGQAPALPAPSPPPAAAAAAEDPPAATAQQPPTSAKAKGKKRAIEITIDSDDDEDGMTEVERLRARVAALERERVKPEPGVKVKEEEKPSLKKVKMEQGGSSGGASSSPKGKKGKPEVIELD
ncbi:hypothetical protein BCR35DRAFT_331951 [Leucosporidium creatinivorum]|uniref:DUF7918 domain-containing protein n=1 Tax=Leucosporidium creatinivorum TaxID=106004 RepID=A0A1Y2F717_9BASI|nr:hypothetical protein BCR35DRAFT_331951 [Leucosporidium creatinivorum]